jgi:hypothetical protein
MGEDVDFLCRSGELWKLLAVTESIFSLVLRQGGFVAFHVVEMRVVTALVSGDWKGTICGQIG